MKKSKSFIRTEKVKKFYNNRKSVKNRKIIKNKKSIKNRNYKKHFKGGNYEGEFKVLVFLHGALTGGLPVRKYGDDKVITLAELDHCPHISYECDEDLLRLYETGHSIFQNDDNTYELTPAGESIQNKEHCHFKFKNHIRELLINNTILDAKGNAPGASRIVVLIKNVNGNYIKLHEIFPNLNDEWDLKTLFYYFDQHYKGNKTFILRSCRQFPEIENKQIEAEIKLLARATSDPENTFWEIEDKIVPQEENVKLLKYPPEVKLAVPQSGLVLTGINKIPELNGMPVIKILGKGRGGRIGVQLQDRKILVYPHNLEMAENLTKSPPEEAAGAEEEAARVAAEEF